MKKLLAIFAAVLVLGLVLFVIKGKDAPPPRLSESPRRSGQTGQPAVQDPGQADTSRPSKSDPGKSRAGAVADEMLLDQFKKIASGSIGNKELAQLESIVAELSSRGHFDEAQALILGNLGYGRQRSVLLGRLFMSSNLPVDDLIKKVNGLEYGDEQESAVGALATRSLGDGGSVGDIDKLLATGHRESVMTSLKLYLAGLSINQKPGDDPKLLFDKIQENLGKITSLSGPEKDSLTQSTSYTMARLVPFESWGLFSSIPQETQSKEVKSRIIHEMVANDKEKALATVLASKDAPADAITFTFAAMISTDLGQAQKTFKEKSGSFDKVQYSNAAAAFFNYSVRSGDIDAANLWLKEISEPALKEKMEKRLAESVKKKGSQ